MDERSEYKAKRMDGNQQRGETMIAEKLFPSGAWLVSDIINNQYVKRTYFGYTKREAIRAFKREVRNQ